MIETTYIRKAKSWSAFSSSINALIENNKKLQAGKIYEKCWKGWDDFLGKK